MTDKEQSAVNYLKIRGHSRANGNVYFVAYNLIRSLQQQLAEKDKRIAELELALRNCLLLAARHNLQGDFAHIARFCESAGVKPQILRHEGGGEQV